VSADDFRRNYQYLKVSKEMISQGHTPILMKNPEEDRVAIICTECGSVVMYRQLANQEWLEAVHRGTRACPSK